MMIRPLRPRTFPCFALCAGLTVRPDGRVLACMCRDREEGSDLCLGDTARVSLQEAWHSGAMQRLRQRFVDGDLPGICRECRHYSPAASHLLAPPPSHGVPPGQ